METCLRVNCFELRVSRDLFTLEKNNKSDVIVSNVITSICSHNCHNYCFIILVTFFAFTGGNFFLTDR